MDALWRHFAWIGVPLFAVSVWALVRSIGGVIRTGREARLVDVPLVERQMRVFDIAVPGPHQLRVEGLTSERRSTDLDASCLLRFKRPHFGTSLAYVVGIVLSACVTIASLVLTALRLGGVGLE